MIIHTIVKRSYANYWMGWPFQLMLTLEMFDADIQITVYCPIKADCIHFSRLH